MGIYIKIQKRQIKIITEKKLKDWNRIEYSEVKKEKRAEEWNV